MSYSGIDAATYIGRIARRNLFDILKTWSAPEARRRSFEVWWWINQTQRSNVRRIVLLGNRVAEAFGVEDMWRASVWRLHRGHARSIDLVAIPHPSGKCRIYNDIIVRRRAGAIVRWAAGLRETLP